MAIPVAKAPLLEGKRGLIVGIANDQSIAWGCAKAFRALGAELAVTYLNDRAKTYVEPLTRELNAPIVMPLDVQVPGQMEAVFERIEMESGAVRFSRPFDRLLSQGHAARTGRRCCRGTDFSPQWTYLVGRSFVWLTLPNR